MAGVNAFIKFNHRVTLNQIGLNEELVESPVLLGTFWSHVAQVSASETANNEIVEGFGTYKIVMRDNVTVNNKTVVTYGSKILDVKGAVTGNGYLEITAVERIL